MILSHDISVVLQGPINKNINIVLQSIIHHLPHAEIIVSTWPHTIEIRHKNIQYIINPDPGSYTYPNSVKENNINRQIVSTYAGVKQATRKYVLKLRTDCFLNGTSFLLLWNKFPYHNPLYQVFTHKILICSYFTRNPRAKQNNFCFHPSDIVFFGYNTDIFDLFDIPLMTPSDLQKYQFVPEQYLFLTYLRKKGHTPPIQFVYDTSMELIELTEQYLANNFIVLDWEEFCLTPPQTKR